eukprot:8564181-Pyramimonas_sp.AAC.1
MPTTPAWTAWPRRSSSFRTCSSWSARRSPPAAAPSAAFNRKTDPTILVVRAAALVSREAVCEGLAEWLAASNFEADSWKVEGEPADTRFTVK